MKANSNEKIILAFGWNNWHVHIWGSGGGKWQTSGGSEMVPRRLSNLWGSLSQVVSVPRQRRGPDYKVFIYNKFLQCRFRLEMERGKWNTLTMYKRPVDKCTHFSRASNINFFEAKGPKWGKTQTSVKSEEWERIHIYEWLFKTRLGQNGWIVFGHSNYYVNQIYGPSNLIFHCQW